VKRNHRVCLFDFANSAYSAVIVATVFGIYYTTTIVGNERGLGDLCGSGHLGIDDRSSADGPYWRAGGPRRPTQAARS